MIKFGIVGTRGLAYAPCIERTGQAAVTALCDVNEGVLKSQAEKYGIRNTYRQFSDMLESDIDAIIISTPMQHHISQCIDALQAGIHVICEVPLGVMMQEMFWLVDEVQSAKGKFFFTENFIYMPEVQHALSIVNAGLIGEPYYAECGYIHNIEHWLRYNYGVQTSGKVSWRKYWQVGRHGAFYPTHGIGPLMRMFGPNERIAEVRTVGCGRYNNFESRLDDSSITLVQLESGKLITLRTDVTSPRPRDNTSYQIQGTNGCIDLRDPRPYPEVKDIHKIWLRGMDPMPDAKWRDLASFDEYMPQRYKERTPEMMDAWMGGGDYFMMEDFIDAIVNDKEPPIDIYDACTWTSVGLLSELSATNNGKVMKMPNFRKGMPYEEQRIVLD